MSDVQLIRAPSVTLIAATDTAAVDWEALAPGWETDAATGGERLIEMAGRACYASWGNPSGRDNAGYLAHLMEMRHFSVIEHTNAAFYLTGISRSASHEIARHRHHSISQLSQRYVDESETAFVVPPALRGVERLERVLAASCAAALASYRQLVAELENEQRAAGVVPGRAARKAVREAARAVLPNATETRMVLTANLRAWRHFCALRCDLAADAEIREVALLILARLKEAFSAVFADFEEQEEDGMRCAVPRYEER